MLRNIIVMFAVALQTAGMCLFGAGNTPIANLKLIGNADGNNSSITNLDSVGVKSIDSASSITFTDGKKLSSGNVMLSDDYRYPLFKLDMEPPYADFEIKATTNNFSGASESEDVVYMYVSSRPHGVPGIPEDDNAYAYFTDDFATDVRSWVVTSNHTSLFTLMINPQSTVRTVYFLPSLGTNDTSSWMYEGNPNLRWSWVRVAPLHSETNAVGRQIWSPIMPFRWSTSRVAP